MSQYSWLIPSSLIIGAATVVETAVAGAAVAVAVAAVVA